VTLCDALLGARVIDVRGVLILALLLAGCGQRLELRGEVGFGAVIGEYLPKVKGEVIYEASDPLSDPPRRCL